MKDSRSQSADNAPPDALIPVRIRKSELLLFDNLVPIRSARVKPWVSGDSLRAPPLNFDFRKTIFIFSNQLRNQYHLTLTHRRQLHWLMVRFDQWTQQEHYLSMLLLAIH